MDWNKEMEADDSDDTGTSKDKRYLYDVEANELSQWIENEEFPPYRFRQIWQWLWRGVNSFDQMTDLPKDLRDRLAEDFVLDHVLLEKKLSSHLDETAKYLWKLHDGETIESVFMSYKAGTSVCVSSQVGCQMGCDFCASSKAGFARDLTTGELLAQVAFIGKDQGRRIDHIVVMGIGEPMQNYDHVVGFLRACNDPAIFNISMRKMTVSTCGIIPQIHKFAGEDMPVTLAISLHATTNRLRSSLMPINRLYPLEDLMDACRDYIDKTGRRISFEYALFSGVNDSPDDARRLVKLLDGMLCHVNLIPGNDVPDMPYKGSPKDRVENFRQIVQTGGIPVTVRRELGADIMAACGQLRRSNTQ